MQHNDLDVEHRLERIVLYLIIAGFVAFIGFRTVRLVNARANNQNQNAAYYQISPLPTFTFTPSPVGPTNTPPPPTPTDTSTPTQLPPTPTDTSTPTPLPPTATDTSTPTPIPPTPTDTPVPNSPPSIDDIIGPTEPIPVNEEAAIVVSFSDPDSGDSHRATVNWGDGTTTVPPIDLGDLVFTETHPYAGSGIYSVVVTITDSAGASDSDQFDFITVYDPDDGFVTGGGWIDSPAGAFKADPELTGKANFGFGAKYQKGKGKPKGNTLFQFQAGDLTFKSHNYQWLILNPDTGTAVYQGKGTINGDAAPNGKPYKFMILASDGSPDKLRIEIWYEESGGDVIVYDNGFYQPLGGGSIIVHKAKGKAPVFTESIK